MSAFGVDLGDVSKARKEPPASGGRIVAGALAPGAHAAVAGKKGHKLRAAGWEVGGSAVAPVIGGGVGTAMAQSRGHYKKQKVSKSNSFTRPSRQNSRAQNTKVGATAGAAGAGSVGAALGGVGGHHEAKAGVGSLKAIGAGPSKLRSARIVGGHAGRKAAIAGAAFGAGGAAYGAAIGATLQAKKKKVSKSAFGVDLGVVSKGEVTTGLKLTAGAARRGLKEVSAGAKLTGGAAAKKVKDSPRASSLVLGATGGAGVSLGAHGRKRARRYY